MNVSTTINLPLQDVVEAAKQEIKRLEEIRAKNSAIFAEHIHGLYVAYNKKWYSIFSKLEVPSVEELTSKFIKNESAYDKHFNDGFFCNRLKPEKDGYLWSDPVYFTPSYRLKQISKLVSLDNNQRISLSLEDLHDIQWERYMNVEQ